MFQLEQLVCLFYVAAQGFMRTVSSEGEGTSIGESAINDLDDLVTARIARKLIAFFYSRA